MSAREQALQQIVELAAAHRVSVREFSNIMHASEEKKVSYAAVRRLLAYLSGICFFSGISAYINMFWHEMNSYERVIITLGSGLCLYIMALVSLGDPRYLRAASPMFLMSAVLQAIGLFVVRNEWNLIANPQHAAICVFGIMLLQQGLTLYKTGISTVLFFTIAYGTLFFATALEALNVDVRVNGLVIGLSLVMLLYGINKIRHTSMSGFWYFLGSLLFLGFSFDLLHGSAFEVSYLAISCCMLYLSVLSHSRMLMTVSVASTLSYIGYFTIEHFVDSIGWPIVLILLGLLFSAISAGAWKLNRTVFYNRLPMEKSA